MKQLKQYTVKELIAELSKHDPNLKVEIEGCDCIGYAGDIKITTSMVHYIPSKEEKPDTLLICRVDLDA